MQHTWDWEHRITFPEALVRFIEELLRSLTVFPEILRCRIWRPPCKRIHGHWLIPFITSSSHYKARPVVELLCSKTFLPSLCGSVRRCRDYFWMAICKNAMLPDKLSKHSLGAQVITREKAILHVQFFFSNLGVAMKFCSQTKPCAIAIADVTTSAGFSRARDAEGNDIRSLCMPRLKSSCNEYAHDINKNRYEWQWRKTMKWGSLQHPVNNYKSYEVIPSPAGNKIWSNKSKQTNKLKNISNDHVQNECVQHSAAGPYK